MIFRSRSPFLFGILVSVTLAACALQAPVADGEAVVLQAPNTAAAAFLVGQAASRSGDLAIAASAWNRALQDDPGNFDLLRRTHLSELGTGNFDAAVKIAQRLAALGASDSYMQIVLALDDVRAGRLLAADASMAKVSDQGINVILVPLLRAWLAAGNRDSKTAEALLAPLRDAGGFGAMRDLHLMLMADYIGDRPRALALAHDIQRDDPAPSLRVATELGAVLERYEPQSQAQKFYQTYREQNPDSPLPALALARLARNEAPPRPVASVKEGVAEGLFDLASLLQRDRSGSELALLLNQMALAMRPDFVFARLLLADIYESQFKPALAAEVFRSVARDPLFG